MPEHGGAHLEAQPPCIDGAAGGRDVGVREQPYKMAWLTHATSRVVAGAGRSLADCKATHQSSTKRSYIFR